MPSICLPEVLDRTTVPGVSEMILAGRNEQLVIDAGAVRRMSALGFEMLLAAARQWQDDGCSMLITDMSDAFVESLGQLGAAPADLCVEAGK